MQNSQKKAVVPVNASEKQIKQQVFTKDDFTKALKKASKPKKWHVESR